MAINLTWGNIGALTAIMCALLVGMFSGTAAMMEWRINGLQAQLSDRMSLYKHEIDQFDKRIERLERR